MADRIFKFDRTQGRTLHWHGKNEIVADLSLDNCCLNDFDLEPIRMPYQDDDGTLEENHWRILRCTDNHSLKVGAPYNPASFTPVKNADFIQLVRDSIGGTSHIVSSCGSLRNRGRVFISVELIGMEKFKAAGREFAAYLNYGNGHDKSSVLWVNTSNIATVCDNTYTCNLVSVENKATQGASQMEDDNLSISKRHTKNLKLRLPALATLIDKAIGVQAEFQLEMDKLAQVSITQADAEKVFAGFLGRRVEKVETGLYARARNTVDTLTGLFVRGAGNNGDGLDDMFGAVTDYYTHSSSGGDNVMRQVLSSEYGAGQAAKAEFWGLVRDNDRLNATKERGDLLLVNTK